MTGGTGFVGANFVYKFLELGHEIHLLTRKGADFTRIESVKNKFFFHEADLYEEESVNNLVAGLKPEIILHFATYGAHTGTQKDAKATILTNVLGTINLLNAASKVGFECFINTGSALEYGQKDHPMSEKDLLEPNSLYGTSKVAGTLYAQYIAKKTNLPIVTMRLFSVYGYFDGEERLMPNIVRAGLKNEEFNAPSSDITRDFVFIEDVLDAYLRAIDNPAAAQGRILNVGSGKQYSIGEVIAVAEKIFGREIKTVYGKMAPKEYEPSSWVADISLAKKVLGWEPKNSLEDGLLKYIDWTQKL